MTRPDIIEQAIRSNTRAIFVETPSNPLLKIVDLAAVAALARERKLLTIVDNTFQTPFLQRPIAYGFDIVVHSATKFLAGHSDVVAGLVVTRTDELGRKIKSVQSTVGAVLGPQDAWLVLRGLKTLAVRMEAQQEAAKLIAKELIHWPEVNKVYYPGIKEHPWGDIHARQSTGPGAVLSFELPDEEVARRVMARVKLCLPAVSLGGVESILSWPARMSHAAMPKAERHARGISNGLLRLSAGLEHPQDILEDLRQAMNEAI